MKTKTNLLKTVVVAATMLALVFTFIPQNAMALSKVSGLYAYGRGMSYISLKWNKVDSATKYQVYRYYSSKKAWKLVKSPTSNATSISKLKANTTYKFKVRAVKGTTKGAFSAAKSIRTARASGTYSAKLNGKKFYVTIGKTSHIPYPAFHKRKGTEAVKVTYFYKAGNMLEIEGTTSRGKYMYSYDKSDVMTRWAYSNGTRKGFDTTREINDNGGTSMKHTVTSSDVEIFWTVDNKEPKKNQANRLGTSTWCRDFWGKMFPDVLLAGTTAKKDSPYLVFSEKDNIDQDNAYWAKAYNKDKLIFESHIVEVISDDVKIK